jgi:hypothetical protein
MSADMVSSFLFISARISRKSVSMIVGTGISHFANQADTLILIYLFVERTASFQKISKKIVRSALQCLRQRRLVD